MDDPSAIAQSKVPRMTRPVLAALAFQLDGRPDWMGQALCGDILDEAVRRGGFMAVSRHTTFRGNRTRQDLHALGANAVISGTTSRTALSVTLDRQDTAPETLTLPVEALGTLRDTADRVADWVIERLGGPLPLPEPEQPSARPEIDPKTHAAVLEALERLWTFTPDGNAAALSLVTDAAERDPTAPAPQALRAMLLTRAYRSGWLRDRDVVLRQVETALGAAYDTWSGEPVLCWTTAFAEAMLRRRYPVAAKLTRCAVEMQPHHSPALTWGALFLTYDLDFDGAEALAQSAMRWSPDDPMLITQGFAGALAAIHAGRDHAALAFSDLVLSRNPKMINVLRIRAAALFNIGEASAARAVMQQILAIDPAETRTLIERVNPLREWPGFGRYLAGLRGAGMPLGHAP
ncbi:hypothetical protein DXV76_00815 [Rhodobacteraceae bacterium CCMM004]|nr:hypothetical protein DXV76_00815 [Rhodobacteraceae bacterium CCMM004]